MKQTNTRDAFIHNLEGERSDKVKNNFMILGHAIFDLHDKIDELHEKFDEILKRTNLLGNVGPPPVKIASTGGIGISDSVKPPKITPAKEDDDIESF